MWQEQLTQKTNLSENFLSVINAVKDRVLHYYRPLFHYTMRTDEQWVCSTV